MLYQGCLYALDTKSTLNIYHELLSSLLGNKDIILYTKDKELSHVFKSSSKIVLTDNIKNATIILISSSSDLISIDERLLTSSLHPILFATDYRLLKKSKSIIGAFYWKKGRSQLLFIKHRLDKYKIHLAPKYRAFIVDEL
jgi:hypothetical protein